VCSFYRSELEVNIKIGLQENQITHFINHMCSFYRFEIEINYSHIYIHKSACVDGCMYLCLLVLWPTKKSFHDNFWSPNLHHFQGFWSINYCLFCVQKFNLRQNNLIIYLNIMLLFPQSNIICILKVTPKTD
jgi:GH43 family beta-xylosidase